ncbi:hypothetical protein E6C60_2404 [Paenibacillus algicola]|uniref:Uncharacterized protein n=1 Tax=Paenibacillus algicola TaxID=2565926 RepID=A0A4P8XK98_9BACL|nr:hypothetical protein E6C60_2404 [Paenibacillus algicola]
MNSNNCQILKKGAIQVFNTVIVMYTHPGRTVNQLNIDNAPLHASLIRKSPV